MSAAWRQEPNWDEAASSDSTRSLFFIAPGSRELRMSRHFTNSRETIVTEALEGLIVTSGGAGLADGWPRGSPACASTAARRPATAG